MGQGPFDPGSFNFEGPLVHGPLGLGPFGFGPLVQGPLALYQSSWILIPSLDLSGNALKMVFVSIPIRIFQFKRITLMKTRYVLT